MKTHEEEWKEDLIGAKIISVEITDDGIKSIIVEKKKNHIKIFQDSKSGINAIFIRYDKGREIFV